jgi:hypothetical protein
MDTPVWAYKSPENNPSLESFDESKVIVTALLSIGSVGLVVIWAMLN